MTTTKQQTAVAKAPRKGGKWIEHVKAYREQNDVSFKVALKDAGATYTKIIKEKVEKKDYKPNPWMQHISAYKNAHPDWKDTMSYKQVLQTCKTTYTPTAMEVTVKKEAV
jgi:ribosomal protein L20